MSSFKRRIGCLVFIGTMLTGCAHLPSNQAESKSHVYMLQQQCPANLTLAVGETLKFVVADNPSTGYSWKLRHTLEYTEATSSYAPNKTEGYLIVGTGGTRTFYFKAQTVGNETIHLIYTRSWEPENVATEWRCPITIQ